MAKGQGRRLASLSSHLYRCPPRMHARPRSSASSTASCTTCASS
jgi:hypothetical protein